MLVDEVEIIVEGGHGGPGKVSFHSKKGGGPSGGDGGRGGDVYVRTSSDIYALKEFLSRNKRSAENGQSGDSNTRSGLNGSDLTVNLPQGSVLTSDDGGEIELKKVGEILLLAKGGLGGRGNESFKSSKNTTPRYAQAGLPGEHKKFSVKLKLIADFGLIGLPNAGKSSILNELTNAQAKIGDYPFTTLEPNLGAFNGKILADIPGLIEGASEGKGLGVKFLKHIETVILLLHCISVESYDPLKDYKIIHEELQKFNTTLLEKEEIILLTKSDMVGEAELKSKIKALKSTKRKILPVSIHNWDSLQGLIKVL